PDEAAARGQAPGAPSVAALAVRHRPVQQRGRIRFGSILAAARVLLLETGLEGFTVEDVAQRAGIPVGSVYQFFPNKLAIVAELDAQDTDALVQDLRSAAGRFPTADWQGETNDLIDHIAEHWAADPSRSAVWLAMRSNATTRSLAAQRSRTLADALLPIIRELTPQMADAARGTVAQVVVEMSQSLLHFSVSDGRPNADTVRELKRMLRAYLRAVALDS
ncbi:MAG: TetR/AcrR family transcriptional regulator, partial [Candidatus Nanopelagicales bacterium]